MGSALKKVRSGEPLAIPAAAYNAFVDAAMDHQRRAHDASAQGREIARQSGIIYVRNDSGEDCERFGVLGLGAPLFSPAYNLDEFKNRVALTGLAPAASSHRGQFAILQEPVGDGKIARALVCGVTPVSLEIDEDNPDAGFADVKDGDAAVLLQCTEGAAQILWREAGSTGTVWAVVRVGLPETPFQPHMILMWSGSADDVPDGWALCDGGTYCTVCGESEDDCECEGSPATYTTVDLRCRFVVGYHSSDGYNYAEAVGNLGAPGDYNAVGAKGGTAWHGYGEYTWDDNVSRRNNHPKHAGYSLNIPDDFTTVDTNGDGATKQIRTIYPESYPSVCEDETGAFEHGGIFNAWTTYAPYGPQFPQDPPYDYMDTDNRPPYFVLAFIERIR